MKYKNTIQFQSPTSKYNKIVVTGSLAYDHIMSMPGRFSDHILPDKLHILNVSFIMKTFRQEFGGTGGNIAYTLSLLQIPTFLVATAGKDFVLYQEHLSKTKYIDLSAVKIIRNENTARGFVITDRDDNQIWGFYDGAMRYSSEMNLTQYLNKDTLLVIAPNDPKAVMGYVNQAISSDTSYIFDPAFNIPHFGIRDLMKAISNSTILIGNDYEITLIKRKLKLSSTQLLDKCHIVVTTLGSKGSLIHTKEQKTVVPSAKPKNESDPTGAGDAYRAGFLAGYIRNLPLGVCGRMGALAAVYTVEKYGTQTHNFTLKAFQERYRKNFGGQPPYFT